MLKTRKLLLNRQFFSKKPLLTLCNPLKPQRGERFFVPEMT